MWENTVFPVHTTEVAPWRELTPLPTPSDRGSPGLCGKGGEVPAVPSRWESCSANTMGVWAITPSSMWERTKPDSSHENEKMTRAVVHMYGLRAQSQVCTQACVPRSWGRTERGGAATQEQHVLVPGRGLGTHRCHLDLLTDFKYKPDISIFCY